MWVYQRMHWSTRNTLKDNQDLTDELYMLLNNMEEAVLLFKEKELQYINNTCYQALRDKQPGMFPPVSPDESSSLGHLKFVQHLKDNHF